MTFIRGILLTEIALLFLSSCNTTPVQRVHSAASLPRFIDIAPGEFKDTEPTAFGGQLGGGSGVAYSDTGNVHGSLLGFAGINFRDKRIAGGFLPYYASARVHHEGTNGIGAVYWAAYHFGGGQIWRFSAQTTIAYMSKVAEEKGCENDVGTLFGSGCTNTTESRTRAEVNATEIGLVFSVEKRFSQNRSIIFALAAYRTKVDTGNELDADTTHNFDRHLRTWNPGVQLGYINRLGEGESGAGFAALIGAQWAKAFNPTQMNRVLLPSADLRIMY